eukprot:1184800-Prorocentrum_minimum.AAC.1
MPPSSARPMSPPIAPLPPIEPPIDPSIDPPLERAGEPGSSPPPKEVRDEPPGGVGPRGRPPRGPPGQPRGRPPAPHGGGPVGRGARRAERVAHLRRRRGKTEATSATCCNGGVATARRGSRSGAPGFCAGVLQGCCRGVAGVSQGCYMCIPGVLQECHRGVTGVFQGCCRGVAGRARFAQGCPPLAGRVDRRDPGIGGAGAQGRRGVGCYGIGTVRWRAHLEREGGRLRPRARGPDAGARADQRGHAYPRLGKVRARDAPVDAALPGRPVDAAAALPRQRGCGGVTNR